MIVLRGLWRLVWVEIKIFGREPLGVIGAIGVPVLLYLILGRVLGGSGAPSATTAVDIPVFAAVLIAMGAALSLITIVATYREGGILKRLRATPLRPSTILMAHVIVKLVLSAATLAVMLLAGRRFYPVQVAFPAVGFTLALLASTASLISVGFVVSSVVPTARFAQPIGTLVFYPMLAISGLFSPIDALPPALQAVSAALPVRYAVSLMRGVLLGEPWSAHLIDLAALALIACACTALATRVFRWE